MTLTQQLITIAMIVLGTAITRYLPFLLFPSGRQTPKYVRYLGKVLPAAVFGLLVIYCLRNVSVLSAHIWHPGITVYRPGRLFAPMETADVIIDCWRDDILHDPCANFVLMDKNMENIDGF